MTLTISDLKYSAYLWHMSNDTFEFYLAHYLDINKDGHFIMMRHDTFMKTPKYFEGEISDTIKNLINEALTFDNYKTDYSHIPKDNFNYDGFTYCLDYKKADSIDHKIQFIPYKCPDLIKRLGEMLDTLIYSQRLKKIDSFNTENYKTELTKFALKVSGPLPKFVKPKIKLGD